MRNLGQNRRAVDSHFSVPGRRRPASPRFPTNAIRFPAGRGRNCAVQRINHSNARNSNSVAERRKET